VEVQSPTYVLLTTGNMGSLGCTKAWRPSCCRRCWRLPSCSWCTRRSPQPRSKWCAWTRPWSTDGHQAPATTEPLTRQDVLATLPENEALASQSMTQGCGTLAMTKHWKFCDTIGIYPQPMSFGGWFLNQIIQCDLLGTVDLVLFLLARDCVWGLSINNKKMLLNLYLTNC